MISVSGVTKRFGSFTAIRDISFEVASGEIVGLLGPNGAGKSTTMRILAGVFPPTSGTARIAGFDVVTQPLEARAEVGYFPERVAAYQEMSVDSYLRYVGRMKGVSAAQLAAQAEAAMNACGLEPVAKRIIGSLSKGFRQRVGIAQALTGEPKVLILDEPTAGLDPEQVAEMRDLIRGLRQDRTVVLSTHILPEVEATCDRVIILHLGQIVAVDTPANLNRTIQAAGRVHIEVSGPVSEVARKLETLAGVVSVTAQPRAVDGSAAFTVLTDRDRDLREDLAHAVSESGWGLRELRSVAYSLEEIFLTLVHEGDSPRNEDANLDHL
jgi:ABC-2 type transport system ATP-binding protein